MLGRTWRDAGIEKLPEPQERGRGARRDADHGVSNLARRVISARHCRQYSRFVESIGSGSSCVQLPPAVTALLSLSSRSYLIPTVNLHILGGQR